jgi:hypothetical protein
MSIIQVNLGQYPNDGAGDDLRTAFEKTNANFDELDRTRVIFAQNLGEGSPIFLDKIGNDLRFRSIRSGNDNATVGFDSEEIVISVEDSINSVEEDTNPALGGTLNLNGFDILGNGNISISGNVTANEVIGTFNGSFNGSFNGTLVGNVLVNDGNIIIQALDSDTNNFNAVTVNGLTFSGSNVFESGTNSISTFIGDGLIINSDAQLILQSNNGVLIDTDLTVTDIINGTISSISNHSLSSLGDVSSVQPNNGQALVWDGTAWGPGTVIGGGGGDLDFGSFSAPAGFSLDLGSF